MKFKKYIFLIIFFFILILILLIYANKTNENLEILNPVEVNDIVETLKSKILDSGWNSLDESNLPGENYQLDYAVFNESDEFIVATSSNLNLDLIAAFKNGETIIYLDNEQEIIGKVIFYNNIHTRFNIYKTQAIRVMLIMIIILFGTSFIYNIYLDKSILKPFQKMQRFTKQISLGNLDFPLAMDKHNLFGSFTESFDIMRTELYKARESERLANISKKELVASLSHDIKTPIASIKSVCELLQLKSKDADQIHQLEIINSKVEQINTLITNLFNATLEELQELKVHITDENSQILTEIIKSSDYNNKCNLSSIPECLIKIDKIRLAQVIDNIISNSYKYAKTEIDVNMKINADYLEIEFQDYGTPIKDQELLLLTNKYYRGENAKEESGAGLGLYISKYFMEKMASELTISNQIGFNVSLKILIS